VAIHFGKFALGDDGALEPGCSNFARRQTTTRMNRAFRIGTWGGAGFALSKKPRRHRSGEPNKTMNDDLSENNQPLPESTLSRLYDLRRGLLHLHKTLLEMERADFERDFGRLTSGELLQLVLNHAQFAWLRQISALVVQMDEMLAAEEPATQNDVEGLLAQARLLFTSSTDEAFRAKYQAALQREPAAVVAHAEVTKLLRSSAGANPDPAEPEA
jgi:hypothetical protein